MESTNNKFTLFFDLSGFLGMSYSQALGYRTDWNTYNMIQETNSNISTQRSLRKDTTLQYYTFTDYSQKTSFVNGQFLHTKRYPFSNWETVDQN